MRDVIIHADDLGLSRSFNAGILEAATRGFLTSTCLRVNGAAYEEALRDVLPQCPQLGLGLHFNIVEGRSTRAQIPKSSLLCDADGRYRLGFVDLYRGRHNASLAAEIEADFRDQLDRALAVVALDHLNSHQHSHGISAIFAIACRLAVEYGVRFVRLPRERPYYTRPLSRHLRPWYPVNLVKRGILNHQARASHQIARQLGVRTNDWFVGVAYTGYMEPATVLAGLGAIPDDAGPVEVLLHPTQLVAERDEHYLDRSVRDYVIQPARRTELETLKSAELLDGMRRLGFAPTNYRKLAAGDASPVTLGITSDRPQPSLRPKLTALVILDETPFYHPEYLSRLVRECDDMTVVAAAVVVLPHGGVLKKYLLKNWKALGVRELVVLGARQVLLGVLGKLPIRLRGMFDGSVVAVLQRFNIPLRYTSAVNTDEFLAWVEQLAPDLILSSASPIFGERLIRSPKVACINRHSALLPACGGILPVFRSVQLGHAFTGASVHYMVKQIDGGPVLSRKWLPIFRGDSLNALYRLCFVLSFEATLDAVRHLRNGTAPPALPETEYPASYFSYPRPEDWEQFRNNGGRFI